MKDSNKNDRYEEQRFMSRFGKNLEILTRTSKRFFFFPVISVFDNWDEYVATSEIYKINTK
jgi:hypothetical protein